MKKLPLWLLTLITAFFVGIGGFVLYQLKRAAYPAELAPPVLIEEVVDCIRPKSFPGRSKSIADLERVKKRYFPERAFADEWEKADDSMNAWYGKHLRAMKESSLLDISDENKEVYRFLWLRSFHHPIVVRAERDGRSFSIYARELDGAGGYEPGSILRTYRSSLSKEEWCDFISLLKKANYWAQETNAREEIGYDGAQWVLEGVKANRYHLVDRWSPKEGAFREACLFLLRNSGASTNTLEKDLY